jgi:hypothetical protein
MTNNPTIDGVSRELLTDLVKIASRNVRSAWSGGICEEARALLDAPVVERHQPFAWFTDDYLTDKSSTTYDELTSARWKNKGWSVQPLYIATPEVTALQSTIAQLQARIGELESLHGEIYQVLGALDASAAALDKVSAAANSEPIPNIELLPYMPTGLVTAMLTIEEVLNKLGYFIGAHYGTQKAFADAMGCSCPFVSQVFSRKRIPNSWLTLIGIKKTIAKNYEIVDATAALNEVRK